MLVAVTNDLVIGVGWDSNFSKGGVTSFLRSEIGEIDKGVTKGCTLLGRHNKHGCPAIPGLPQRYRVGGVSEDYAGLAFNSVHAHASMSSCEPSPEIVLIMHD